MTVRGTPGFARALVLPAACLAAAVICGVAFVLVPGTSRSLLVATVSLALYGLFQLTRSARSLVLARRRADDWLRHASGRMIPPAYAWRAAQLVSIRRRRLLAHTLRLVVQCGRDTRLGTHRPRLAARSRHRASLEAVASTLEHESEPVTPAGMLRVAELVTDGTGPLWGTSDEALSSEIESTLAVLKARDATRRAA